MEKWKGINTDVIRFEIPLLTLSLSFRTGFPRSAQFRSPTACTHWRGWTVRYPPGPYKEANRKEEPLDNTTVK